MNARRSEPAAILALPTCTLAVYTQDAAICELVFLAPDTPLQTPRNALAQHAAQCLSAYLDDPCAPIDLPFAPSGSAFQKQVWQQIAAIPVGEVRRYGDIAAAIGSAARAVGQACGANPLPVFVPCHRVIAAKGLGGFAHHKDGWLIATKRWLLTHEGVI